MGTSNTWIHRTEIRSESSNRVYVVSQHATKRHWGCSCPGWRTHRKCKHLDRLGLPGGEQPFEMEEGHAMKKGFLDGYKTYDASAGHGGPQEWQQTFAHKMGLGEAREALHLAPDAGWDEVRRAFQLAATESMTRLVGDYETAALALGGSGLTQERAQAVQTAKFRVEAYSAYLEEQKEKLEAEAARVTGALLQSIKALQVGRLPMNGGQRHDSHLSAEDAQDLLVAAARHALADLLGLYAEECLAPCAKRTVIELYTALVTAGVDVADDAGLCAEVRDDLAGAAR